MEPVDHDVDRTFDRQELAMWTKATVVGGIAAVAVVAGGAGMAIASAHSTAGSDVATVSPAGGSSPTVTPSPSATTAGKSAKDGLKQMLGRLKDFQHAEWVTKGNANSYVTHEAILGQIQAVFSTSITVASSDGTSMTFAVDDQTKVRQRQAQGTASAAVADLKTGQTVLVGGEKAPGLIARDILVRAS